MRSVASVSLSVCNALTFVNLDLETLFWHVGTSSGSSGRSYVEVIGPSHVHGSKKACLYCISRSRVVYTVV